ncbi:MAG: hypothetical protein KJ964_08080 [Verrucomicrobia bacterium]|nr:hypothetical protein [Verrucomicrobiota bacterium]
MAGIAEPVSLSHPIVFVLGAGASATYGFPLGTELKQRMLGHLNRKAEVRMAKLGFDKELVSAFRESLKYSQHATIDIFLEHKTNFRELGSYLIASTIMPLEVADNLFSKRDWYWDLYKMLRFDQEEPRVDMLGVVTLNYERSFEHFMTKTIDFNVHQKYVDAAHAKRTQMRIIHAHGSLGAYPDVPYGINPDNETALRQAAQSIKIVSDTLDNSPDFRAAQELIAGAENVIFLGFGFNGRTLNALLRNVDMRRTRFFGTAVKLQQPAKEQLNQSFNSRFVLGGENQDCAAFLRYIGVCRINRHRRLEQPAHG